MTGAPAAVASTPAPSGPDDIGARLASLLEHAYRGEGRDLAERLLPAPSFATSSNPADADVGFSWLAMPAWLATSLGLDSTPHGRRLLDDLCWAQYCVYALFRVQDDLVDGETDDRTLAVATNPLLIEAARCVARHFDGESPFWPIFQEAVDATTRAILALGRRQRSSDRRPREELRLYAELSASLGIATAGVAVAAGRTSLWHLQLSPALGGLAIATQIVDDLRDVREDLDAGFVNYAAWFLSHPILAPSPEAVEAVIASNLATSNRMELLLERAGDAMDSGLAALDESLCPPLYEFLLEYRRALPALGARVQRSAGVVLSGSTQNL